MKKKDICFIPAWEMKEKIENVKSLMIYYD